MEFRLESSAEEMVRLRRRMNDLGRIMALRTVWTGGEPPRIASTLLESLVEMFRLTFAFVRLNDLDGGPPTEMARVAEGLQASTWTRDIGKTLAMSMGHAPVDWPSRARLSTAGFEGFISSMRLGLRGEFGVVVCGYHNAKFPDEAEALLLDVAANQATLALQQAHLASEQKRGAGEVDQRVARRTPAVAAANYDFKDSGHEPRLIIDSIPGLVALLTPAGDLEVLNPQLLEYFGQTKDELRQWATNGTIHPEDVPHVVDVFTRSLAAGTPYDIVQRFRRSDGVYRWFQNRGFPIHDANGHIARWCVLLTDIDDRKRAEDAVRASEHNLKMIIDTIPALVWSARTDGSAEFFNQHYLDYVGLSTEEASDWGWTAAVHPDDLNGLAAVWQRIMASEETGEAEARLRRHDGEYRWFLFRASPLRNETGKIVKWYGVNTDIDRRKRGEAELRRAYDSFADAQRLSRTGNFTADIVADDHIWSAELYRIFEIDPATEIKLQIVHDMIHPEDLPPFDAAFARSLGGEDFDQVFRIVTRSGRLKHVHSVGHFIERVAGRPLFIGAIQDVTESKIAEEALDRARSELAHVARVATLSTLTASIAHEVNQPLSGIVTNAGTCLRMLNGDPPNIDGARETARRTIRDGNRAADVITRLRALFSKKEFTLEPLDLNEATREVIALSLSDLQRNRVILRSELAEDIPLITGDRIQLQQVILNLLRNASDAMVDVEDRPRELLIRTEREDGDRVRVTVRDAGVGIDCQSMEKLFDAFYTTKRVGMGIGLSVSRSIVERHHGRLWAEPNDGPGATFSFSIPQHRESATGETPVERNS